MCRAWRLALYRKVKRVKRESADMILEKLRISMRASAQGCMLRAIMALMVFI